MNGKITALDLWEQAWDLILTSAGQADRPFGTPVVGNAGRDGLPRQRTVVLRGADKSAATLTHYTDRRSVKASELTNNPIFSYLFWDAEQRIQFSGHGPTRWLMREEAKDIFDSLPKHGRKAYATVQPPSTHLPDGGSGLPPDWEERTLPETDYARGNFGVLVTTLQYADVLLLDREGNRRLTAVRDASQQWQLRWIVP